MKKNRGADISFDNGEKKIAVYIKSQMHDAGFAFVEEHDRTKARPSFLALMALARAVWLDKNERQFTNAGHAEDEVLPARRALLPVAEDHTDTVIENVQSYVIALYDACETARSQSARIIETDQRGRRPDTFEEKYGQKDESGPSL